MKTITLKLTDQECRLITAISSKVSVNNSTHIMWVENRNEDGSGGVIEVTDVNKFREFLNDAIINQDGDATKISAEQFYIDYNNLKSILSKLDKAVVLNNLQKQITKVEEIDKDFCDMVAEGCNADEGDGQFYNGVRIDEDTILVLSTWYDRTSNSEDYFHYSISKDKLISVDAEMDEKYRDLFEDCNMLDYTDCFYIMGVSPTKDNKAVIDYGDEYIDTIVNMETI